jgi:hypothetical protein
MKIRSILVALSLVLVGSTALADGSFRDNADSLSIGFDVSSFSNNYGVGGVIVSPKLLDGRLWFQLAGDYAWVQGNAGSNADWFPYGNFRLGICSGRFLADNVPIRFYTEAGAVLLVNGSSLSSEKTHWGTIGLIGLEFFLDSHAAPFIELGGMGTGAKADQLQGVPIYANGFVASWGFKCYL